MIKINSRRYLKVVKTILSDIFLLLLLDTLYMKVDKKKNFYFIKGV